MVYLFLGIIYILIAYLYFSAIVFIYSAYKKRNLDEKPLFGIEFLNKNFFEIGAFIACFIFLQAGAERVLFFIPGNWGGYNEEGDWQTIKGVFSYMLSFFLTVFLADLIRRTDKFNKRRKKY